MKWLPACLLAMLLLAAPASAAPTVSCHCFRDRAFDPDRPAAADRYFLATAQNSLMAAVFDIDKGRLVRAKMGGWAGEELWVAHYLAARSDVGHRRLLTWREQGVSWREVAARAGIRPETLPRRFYLGLVSAEGVQELAEAAVDDILVRYLAASPEVWGKLRRAEANNHQTILSLFLAAFSEKPAFKIWKSVRREDTSWGRLLADEGISGDAIELEMRRLVD